jgi:hypothetical protein
MAYTRMLMFEAKQGVWMSKDTGTITSFLVEVHAVNSGTLKSWISKHRNFHFAGKQSSTR